MNDEAKKFAADQLKRIVQQAPTARELAWKELQRGVDPLWVAAKYQLDPQRMLAAKQALDERAEAEIAKLKDEK